MKPVPILFISDSPELNTGLARIGRDLAVLLSRNPRFRVGFLGLGGLGSSQLPFQQYQMQAGADEFEFGWNSLPRVWHDFAKGQPGIVFTIWDLSRLLWLARPEFVPSPELKEFLSPRPFRLWSYLPIDSTGVNGKLSVTLHDTLIGIDRIMVPSPWARDLVQSTIGEQFGIARGLDWMPHGIDDSVFRPSGQKSPTPLVGVVAANQARKDWGLVAKVCARLKEANPETKFLWHTDQLVRYWNLITLAIDHGLNQDVTFSMDATGAEMAEKYSQCTVTIAPGLGEGFGYPIFESLACGTPVIHGDYAGGASLMRTLPAERSLIKFMNSRTEGIHGAQRPVFSADAWVDRAKAMIARPDDYLAPVDHLYWKNLWPRFNHWFEDGVRHE